MRFVTNLMDKIFSDSTPEEFKNAVSDKIAEAKLNGQAELKDENCHYSFAENDGEVIIEDKSYSNELTIASENADGSFHLEGLYSATQPDVEVPAEHPDLKKNILPEDSTVDDIHATIEKTAGIVDKDKAGVDKHYSLCIHGFETPEEAQAFFSSICEDTTEDACLTFSTDELVNVAYSADEAQETMERLQGTMDINLAFSLAEQAEQLKAYSVLADANGHNTGDLYEAACVYSEVANEALNAIFSDMDVNEFFSDMDEDEVNDYFSNLDEVEANVLYSCVMDDESYSFSEVQEIVNSVYSDMELEQEVTECFSDMNEDEVNEYFSQFSESEQNVIFSVLEENENATFSDLNEALAGINVDVNSLFSDMSEDELTEFCNEYSEYELEGLQSMIESEDTYLFSDFLDFVIDNRSFSMDDLAQIAVNATELAKAYSDMQETQDPELAKQVKILADQTIDDCDAAEAAGHDTEAVKTECAKYSEEAAKLADEKGEDPVKPEGEKPAEEPKAGEGEKPAEEPKAPEAPKSGEGEKPAEEPKAEEGESKFSSLFEDGTQRVFSKSGSKQVTTNINPCLTSVIH